MIRGIAADVAAYSAGLTVEDLTSYRRAGLVDGIGERQTNAFHYSLAEVLFWLAPLRALARSGFGLQRAHAIVRREFQRLAASADAPDATEHIVVIDVSAPVTKRRATEEAVTDADVPKTRVVVDFGAIAAFARARLEFATAARHSIVRRRGSQRPTVAAIHSSSSSLDSR